MTLGRIASTVTPSAAMFVLKMIVQVVVLFWMMIVVASASKIAQKLPARAVQRVLWRSICLALAARAAKKVVRPMMTAVPRALVSKAYAPMTVVNWHVKNVRRVISLVLTPRLVVTAY